MTFSPPLIMSYSTVYSTHDLATCYGGLFLNVFGRGEWIRTTDLTVPNRALYQAEPRPDALALRSPY